MIDVQRLRVWQAVVASGSVHAAARHLGYTPSTVSQHVKLLQRETGLTLATRVGRGIEPTPAGLRLAEEGSEVVSRLSRLDHVVADLRDGRTDHLSIACFASVAQTWVPQVARRLRQELPGVVLEVSISEPHGGPGRRVPDLEVVSESPDAAGPLGAALIRHDLGTDPFVVALPSGHRLAADEEVRLAELAEETWVDNVVYDSPTLQILTEACLAAGFQPQFAARCDDHQAALGLVAAGLGVTGLPSLAASQLPEGVVAVPLVDPVPRRRIVVHQRQLTAHTRASVMALEALEELATGVSG